MNEEVLETVSTTEIPEFGNEKELEGGVEDE